MKTLPALLAPLSFLVDANHEWVMYTNFVTTGGKQYLQTVSAINAEWLTVSTSNDSLFYLVEQIANTIRLRSYPSSKQIDLPRNGTDP